ncbi:enoyl CoA hydratase domain-containing protein 1 [Apophysomyces ossiformis]|uniref:Enoyl CoA hydratase domain-containing protein 1 n=1 Tax=Apophysomyces ossiformis TaxID=679940 RepID=A0A8H7EM64_9FUNG|nr:enoyl CoA hydratase domain-containing protein 1 [Apophysomyces ossiformis]
MSIPTFTGTESPSTIALKLHTLGQGSVRFIPQHVPGIALIILDNARRHNAFSGKMMVEFRDIILQLEREPPDDLVGLIVTGCRGKAFCSVFVRDYGSGPGVSEAISRLMHDTLTRLARLSLITVASMAGPALGAGTELLTAFDFVCMNASTHLRFIQTRRGITSPWGGLRRLVNRVGRKNALLIMGSAPRMSATDGQRFGLVDCVVPCKDDEGAYDACLSAATDFLQPFVLGDDKQDRVSVHAVRGMKELVVRADLDADSQYEMKLFAKTVGSSKL